MNTSKLTQREIFLLLGGMTAIAFLLLLFRIRIEGNFRYLFLVWNLFLAYVPIGFVMIYNKLEKNRISKSLMLGSWLLFFPNAPYILTDFIHLQHHFSVLDLLIVAFYAVLGLIAGFYSLRMIHKDAQLLNRRWSIPFLFFITSIGVYLGRILRWNSWDIVHQPLQIFKDGLDLFIHPIQNGWSLAFVLLFTLFLMLTYSGFRKVLQRIHEEKEI